MAESPHNYRETRPLAEGGMAVLTLAERDDDLEVVIKRIRPPFDHDATTRSSSPRLDCAGVTEGRSTGTL